MIIKNQYRIFQIGSFEAFHYLFPLLIFIRHTLHVAYFKSVIGKFLNFSALLRLLLFYHFPEMKVLYFHYRQ